MIVLVNFILCGKDFGLLISGDETDIDETWSGTRRDYDYCTGTQSAEEVEKGRRFGPRGLQCTFYNLHDGEGRSPDACRDGVGQDFPQLMHCLTKY